MNDIGSNIGQFADYASLFLVAENTDTAAETLNSDLEKKRKGQIPGFIKFNPAKQKPFNKQKSHTTSSPPSLYAKSRN